MKNRLLGTASYDRAAKVVNAIEKWNAGLSAELQYEKYCKMAASPFIFYRGTDHLFWSDFADGWRLNRFGSVKTRTWLQGDAHAENMGAFYNDIGGLVYGLNDFDESIIADYQYDLWRFAVSLVLVARQNGGFSEDQQNNILDVLSQSYLDTLASYVGNKKAQKVFFTANNTKGDLRDFLKETDKDDSRKKMLKKWTNSTNGNRRFDLSLEKLGKATTQEKKDITDAMPAYGKTLKGDISYNRKFFKIKDIARRLDAGTGSLGTPRFYILIEGKSKSTKDDRILDVKLQSKPSGYWYLSDGEQIEYDQSFENDAQRQEVAYQALGKHPDDLLGWMKLHNGYYSVRERSPFKETFPTNTLTSEDSFIKMTEQWAKVLATDHARAEHKIAAEAKLFDFQDEVMKLVKGRHKEFRALVRAVAHEYADQVEADYGYFKKKLGLKDCPPVV